MKKRFLYLSAVIDVHIRYVLNWSISNSMDAKWVTKLMEETIEVHGEPKIINTDQGSNIPQTILLQWSQMRREILNEACMEKVEPQIMYLLKLYGKASSLKRYI